MLATSKYLRFHTSELLGVVDKGEDVIITYRGIPRAKLTQCNTERTSLTNEKSLFGLWKDRDIDVDSYVRNLRKGRYADRY